MIIAINLYCSLSCSHCTIIASAKVVALVSKFFVSDCTIKKCILVIEWKSIIIIISYIKAFV